MPNQADKLQEAIARLTSTLQKPRDADSRVYDKLSSGLLIPSKTIIKIVAAHEARNPFSNAVQGYDRLHSGLLVQSQKLTLPSSQAPAGYERLANSGIFAPQRAVPSLATGPVIDHGIPIKNPAETKYIQAERNFAADRARLRAYMAVKGDGGSALPPSINASSGGESEESKAAKKTASGFGLLNTKMLAFAAVVGVAIKGLQGTKEGYLLDYSVQHVFFEIADMLRGPIRFITREIEGFARVLHTINQSSGGNGPLGIVDAATNKAINLEQSTKANQQNLFTQQAGNADIGARNHNERLYDLGIRQMQSESDRLGRDIEKQRGKWQVDVDFNGVGWHKDPNVALKAQYDSAIEQTKRLHEDMKSQPAQNTSKQGPARIADANGQQVKGEPHLQPQLTVSFGAVEGLQSQLQKLATENPAQEKGLSLVEQIYNVLVSINNSMPAAKHIEPIPQGAIKAG